MATTAKHFLGLGRNQSGSGCSYVYCVSDCRSRTIKTTNAPECQGLWVALCENESKLSITVCEKTAHRDDCESQPTFTFYRNAVLEVFDETSVLITDPFSMSCFFSFKSEAQCARFCHKVDTLLVRIHHQIAEHDDLERERQIYAANDYTDPFIHLAPVLEYPRDKEGVIIETDAGLGMVADAIMTVSRSRYIVITRPGVTALLNRYFCQTHGNGLAFSDSESEERYNVGVAAVVSSRLVYLFFDCEILKRFLRFRDTILSPIGQLLPTEIVFYGALITAGEVCQEKRNKASFWLTTPFGIEFSDLYITALEEEFLVPEIGVPVTKMGFVCDILGSSIILNDPRVTEKSMDAFGCQYVFIPRDRCTIDGIVLWCSSIVNNQQVSHTRIPPASSITCLLEQSLDVWPGRPMIVTCYFNVNHTKSYDISVHYSMPPLYDCNAGYSLMLARPHPFGKSLRREPDVKQSEQRRVKSEEIRHEIRESSEQGGSAGVFIPRKTLASRGFLC